MRAARCAGFTLIDVLVLIVLLGTIAGAFVGLFGKMSAQSAQSLRDRQALALAESLLAEVRAMPFTYCDANDARATQASGAFVGGSGCATSVDGLGPEAGESRYSAANRFDGVSDYQGLNLPGAGCAGICDINGTVLNPADGMLAGCSANVAMAPQAMPGIAALDANGRPQVLRVVVTVRCPGRRRADPRRIEGAPCAEPHLRPRASAPPAGVRADSAASRWSS